MRRFVNDTDVVLAIPPPWRSQPSVECDWFQPFVDALGVSATCRCHVALLWPL